MLMLLLIGQTILGPMGTITVNAQDTQSTSSFDVTEGKIDGDLKKGDTVRAQYDWNLSGEIDAEITKELQLPEQLTAPDLASTDLYVDGQNVGSYSVAENKLSIVMYKTELPKVEPSEEKPESEENADETTDEEDSMTSPGSDENESNVEKGPEEQVESENQDLTKEEQTEDNIQDSEVIEKVKTDAKQEQQFTAKTLKDLSKNPVALSTLPIVIRGAGTITLEAIVDENAEGTITFGGKEYPIEEKDAHVTLQSDEKHGFSLSLGKVTDLNDVEYSDVSSLKLTDEFKLHLTWKLENGHNYKADDTKVFNLPQGIKIQQQFEIELKDEDGQLVAIATIGIDNTVNLKFTNYVEKHSNVTGYLEIISMIDQDNAEVDNGEIVLQPIGDEGVIRIPIDMSDRKKTIEKIGTPNKGYNPDEINWAVTVNKMKLSLTQAEVTDLLPAGTEYKVGSLKVTKLIVDFNGNVLGDSEVVNITGVTANAGTLLIPLGDIADAYRIEYVTTVTSDTQKTFKNNAQLTDEKLETVSANATVTINRGEPVKKSAVKSYNPKTGIIEWEIQFNYNQKSLENVTLKDAWTPVGKMELVENSLKFQEVTIDENGNAGNNGEPINLPSGATLVNGIDQFEVTGIITDKAYKVTYQTIVKDRVLEAFEVSNTTGFGPHSSTVTGTKVGTYYGSKSAGNVDYHNKTIDWKIEINHDEYPMKEISITDTLGAGLTLKEESLKVTVNGNEYPKEDYTLTGVNPFTIKFLDTYTTDKKIVITYKTNYVADLVPGNKATNKADITWTPEGSVTSITKEVTAETKLNQSTGNNHWKNGSYNPSTKEITWTIYTNYRENVISDLIIKDTPLGNQKIIADSVIVKELSIAGNGKITEGNTLEDLATVDVDSNTMEVKIGSTNKAYKIEYKTSIADLSDIQKEYVNAAEVFDSTTSLSKINAKVGIANAHVYGAKSGKQDGKQIHWSVTVNPGQQKVTNLQLEDTISENQEYLIDTVKVYKATVNNDGKATKTGEPISSDRYTFTHVKDTPTFTIIWNDTVERAFVVEYSTLFYAKHNDYVTNSYKINADHIVDGGNVDGGGSVQVKQFGSGGGAGEVGYLVVTKYGTTDGVRTANLSGVEFELIDSVSKAVLKSGTTDADGKIDFGRLLYGKYLLKEVKAPEGYVGASEQEIEINQPYVASDASKKGQTKEVENKKIRQILEFTKTDLVDGTPIDGVVFELQKADIDGNYHVVTGHERKVTENGGKILIENLEPGNYQLVEVQTAEGYWKDETPVKFKITKDQTTVEKATMTNDRVGELTFLKVAKEDETKFLPGATFKLTNKDDSEISFVAESNENGFVTFKGVKYGDYTLVETVAPTGYISTKVYDVTINEEINKLDPIVNEKVTQAVKLIKTDDNAISKTKLEGAEFTLYTATGEIVEKNMDGESVPVATNSEGELIINKLQPGDYYFLETKAPTYYVLDENEENRKTEVFTIKKNQTIFTNVTKENKRGTGSLVITKQDAASRVVLSDTEFELFNSKNESQGKKVTDASGQITYTDLPYDTYTLKETRAKAGYVPNNEEYVIIVSDADVDGKVFTKTITNAKINRSVHLSKYNADRTLTLPNAVFELRKMNSNLPEGYEVVSTINAEKLVTDENGTIYLNGLQPGSYEFVETKAPAGYYINREPVRFTISTYQISTVYVEKTNNRIPDPEWPGPVEPGKPVDPDKPKPGEPEKPVDPDKPNPEEPGKPDPEEPSKPGEENPDNPITPSEPGEEDPNDLTKPVKPGKEDPNKPGNNGEVEPDSGEKPNDIVIGKPSKPGKPGTGTVISSGGNKGNAVGKATLPQTGEEKYMYMLIIGFTLIVMGGFMVRRRRTN